MEQLIRLRIPEGDIPCIHHPFQGARSAILLVDGAGGGTMGPSGIYPVLASELQTAGVAGLRLDYRHPNDLENCVTDVLAGIAFLVAEGVERIVLVGWSFGGAVVITAGAISEHVVGVATVASQTYGADAVNQLAPKHLLLLHGTGDPVLPDRCSRDLYARAKGPREIVLYPGDNHGIELHAQAMLSKLLDWSKSLLLDQHP